VPTSATRLVMLEVGDKALPTMPEARGAVMRINAPALNAAFSGGAQPAESGVRRRTIGSVNGRPNKRSGMAWIRVLARDASTAAIEPYFRRVRRFREPGPAMSGSIRSGWVFIGPPSPATRHETARALVLLVPGLGGTTSGCLALAQALQARGLNVAAISYRSFRTSLEQLAVELADTVLSLQIETGAERVHLVGHSLGGVVIAQALADGLLAGRVDSVVTIAAPFGGTRWANLLPVGAVVRALRQGSPQLGRLARAHVPSEVRWLAITAGSDRIVRGHRSLPAHAEVETVEVHGAGHVGVLQNAQVISQVASAIIAGPVLDRAIA
jgi:triacylglycerol lipase